MSESTTLVEQSADWRSEARVDRAARLVRNVALAGAASRNGYRYAESALRDGAVLYERKPVFLDHAPDPRRPQERSTRDLVGSIVQSRYEGGRIRGDIQVLDTEAGQTFLSLVESDAAGVGMSHVVLAERGGDGSVVERIHDVISVDAVVGPATTTTFRESAGAGEQAGGRVADEGDGLQCELAAVRGERDRLASRLAALEREQSELNRRAEARRLLASSGLPDFALTPLFMEQLTTAPEAAREQLISERRDLIARSSLLRPQSAERFDVSGRDATAAFVAAIRGERRVVCKR